MNEIAVLDQQTINKIAAGEVIERPASVVKELAENAIDAGANAVTVEIRDGGISFIRVTDNGAGIEARQVPTAFLRHATSKIRKVDDLLDVGSLGFRGEALSSIAAVCQVELITKTADSLTGLRYLIEGGQEKGAEEIGAPGGSTFLVRNLFYNTPARKKFLKTAQTEAGYVGDLIERIALSHPDVSFKFIANGQTKLHTSGNHNLKDIIYNLYGRDIAANVMEVSADSPVAQIRGFIGKPVIARGNRNYENYFVNGRWVKSSVIAKAIEDAYHSFMMKHKYPFTVLQFTIDGNLLDINVHPTKMELRFADNEQMYRLVYDTVHSALSVRELIVEAGIGKEKQAEPPKEQKTVRAPEPFETVRRQAQQAQNTAKPLPETQERKIPREDSKEKKPLPDAMTQKKENYAPFVKQEPMQVRETPACEAKPLTPKKETPPAGQMDLFEARLLSKESVKEHRIIGQAFGTYWIVQFQDKLFLIDQHAAHEKVLYERTMKSLRERTFTSQNINPPIILSLSMTEEAVLKKYRARFAAVGFEIEDFGGREYALRAVPDNLFGLADRELFLEMLDALASQNDLTKAELIDEKIASMSCKAAVKGNTRMSAAEAHALIDELLTLENPYNCPHGRPTIISMTKYELERKFKRIV